MICKIQEAENDKEIQLVRKLIQYYHVQGINFGGGAGKHSRFFMYMCKNENEQNGKYYITAVAWLHDNTPFRFVAQHYNIPNDRTYFIRRITKTCPGNYLIDFLHDLSRKLKNDGFEAIWTLGFPDHSNSLYKNAGFIKLGETVRSKHPVFILKLQELKD